MGSFTTKPGFAKLENLIVLSKAEEAPPVLPFTAKARASMPLPPFEALYDWIVG
jgi:hypothetical protein